MRLKQRQAYFSLLDGVKDDPVFVLKIRRDHLLEDSLAQIPQNDNQLKKKLFVTFEGEEGVDAGGLKKEYFLLLCRQLFSSKFGLFIRDEDSGYCWFNPATNTPSSVELYHLLGVVLGLAIYNSTILDIQLPPALFKRLLGQPCTIADLKLLHPALGSGIQQLLDFQGDVETIFCRNFVVDREIGGKLKEIPLCRGGERMAVTNKNRREFVQLFTRYVFEESCSRSMFHLSRGMATQEFSAST